MMDSVTLENFRCFRERQTVRLAPLTLLVGENSTGKTSFLAMLRALATFAYAQRAPDFKEPPYDLGSFDEIVHSRSDSDGQAESFEAGFTARQSGQRRTRRGHPYEFGVTFAERGTAPVPIRRRIAAGNTWVEDVLDSPIGYSVRFGTSRGAWTVVDPAWPGSPIELGDQVYLYYALDRALGRARIESHRENGFKMAPLGESPEVNSDDLERLGQLEPYLFRLAGAPPFASAPVRSKPHRTYNPARLDRDPEGDYVPMYLADLLRQQDESWGKLKKRIEEFGKSAGLFDELSIRQFGTRASEPFQVQVRRGDNGSVGPERNLLDVGYGVSQVLPIVTEILRPDTAGQHLLQQPEVHLHPSAQAALGTLFCQVAATGRQLIVETHSDHLIDRVRMDVRDETTNLKPEDVSLLYFERNGLDVRIHSLRFDELGNVLDAPPGYRSFFMQEVERSLWPPK